MFFLHSKMKQTFLNLFYVLISLISPVLSTDFKVTKWTQYPNLSRNSMKFVGVSVGQCVDECTRRLSCGSVGYRSWVNLCEVHLDDVTPEDNADDGSYIFIKKDDMLKKEDAAKSVKKAGHVCDESTGHCHKECETFVLEKGKVYGNRRHAGAKVAFSCHGGYREKNGEKSAVCEQSGEWSYYPKCLPVHVGVQATLISAAVTTQETQINFQETTTLSPGTATSTQVASTITPDNIATSSGLIATSGHSTISPEATTAFSGEGQISWTVSSVTTVSSQGTTITTTATSPTAALPETTVSSQGTTITTTATSLTAALPETTVFSPGTTTTTTATSPTTALPETTVSSQGTTITTTATSPTTALPETTVSSQGTTITTTATSLTAALPETTVFSPGTKTTTTTTTTTTATSPTTALPETTVSSQGTTITTTATSLTATLPQTTVFSQGTTITTTATSPTTALPGTTVSSQGTTVTPTATYLTAALPETTVSSQVPNKTTTAISTTTALPGTILSSQGTTTYSSEATTIYAGGTVTYHGTLSPSTTTTTSAGITATLSLGTTLTSLEATTSSSEITTIFLKTSMVSQEQLQTTQTLKTVFTETTASTTETASPILNMNMMQDTGMSAGKILTSSPSPTGDINHHRNVKQLLVHNGGQWGDWGDAVFCPEGSYASGYDMKIQPYDGPRFSVDDTALNSIKLFCKGQSEETITPEVGGQGDWVGPVFCNISSGRQFFLTAFDLQVQQAQGYLKDDTAANFVKFKCRDLSGVFASSELAQGPDRGRNGLYGIWSEDCLPGTAICGLKTKVEAKKYLDDDTALNDVIFYCCY